MLYGVFVSREQQQQAPPKPASSQVSVPSSSAEEKPSSSAVADNAVRSASLPADHQPPQGDGRPLEGELPKDTLPETQTQYDFPPQFYPYRAMLSLDEQAVYDQVYANAAALYDRFPLHAPVPIASLERVMVAVFCDHPGLFWLDTTYRYDYTPQGQVVAVTLNFNATADNIDLHRYRFDSAVAEVVAGAQAFGSAVEQEKYVHDYLVDNTSYVTNSPLNQSAYSALVDGQSVCAGYARAFQHILQQLGIPCYYCTGYAGEAHAWNIVRLGEDYYHVDVAWNDPVNNTTGRRFYDYFNLTDKQIEGDHTRTDLSVYLPACRGTDYSYTSAFGADEAAEDGITLRTRSPEEAGLDRYTALSSLDAYYTYCEDKLVELGAGTHSFTLLLSDKDILDAVIRQTESGEALEAYIHGAALRLGYSGYTSGVSLKAEGLTDGYYMLTQQVEFTDETP